jgi:hypothetical protein
MEGSVKYVHERAVAEMTGLAVATLRNHLWRGCGIHFVKVGRSARYLIHGVLDYMKERTVEVDPQW